jgi:hypothetical protein
MIPFRSTAVAALALIASSGLANAQNLGAPSVEYWAQAETPTAQAAPQSGMAAQDQNDDEDDNDEMMAGGMMGPGMMGPGMMGGGMMGPGMMRGGMMGQGMAGDGMMPMMRMMQGMMQMMQGMMQMMQEPHRHWMPPGMMSGAMVEARLAALKEELGITDAQQPQWNAFADALRMQVKEMREMHAQMMRQGPMSWPDRIALHEQRLMARLAVLKAMEAPTKALWDALSEEQRHKAEGLMMMGPMGMRRMGMGPMGMMGRM